MDYIVTFDDGSRSLMHYGVKGMKWGRWNAETQRRYAGAGNGTFYRKASYGTEYGRAVTDLRRKYNANQPKAKQALKNVVMTPLGAHAYNTSRSRGLSRSESLINAQLGPLYAQGVKLKQISKGTTKPVISKSAKIRSEYSNADSFAKQAAKLVLLKGPLGATGYNTVKATTKSRGKAAVAALAPLVVGSVAAGVGGAATAANLLHPEIVSPAAALTTVLAADAAVGLAGASRYAPMVQSYIKKDFAPKAKVKPR